MTFCNVWGILIVYMDQAENVNSGGSFLSSSSNIPTQNKSRGRGMIFYIMCFILALVLGSAGYFFGLQVGSKSVGENLGNGGSNTKFEELIEAGGDVVRSAAFQIIYGGSLVEVSPNQSWTLEKNGEKVIITNEGSEQIRYFSTVGQSGVLNPANANDLKIGDNLSVMGYINPNTGVFTVIQISINKPSLSNEATSGSAVNP